jgi:hypothetical protein
MKKLLIGVAALGLASTPAFADNTLTYNLDADVGSICGVWNYQGDTIAVPFGDLALTPDTTQVVKSAGSATYRCNSPAGFDRTIHSANGGKMVRTGSSGGAGNEIAYEMSHGGGSGLNFAYQALTTDRTDAFGGSLAFLSGQSGGVNFRTNGVWNQNASANNAPGTTVFAGDYTDVVTISVTAN